MANRMKEDEKNEKIIRGLLKLPANKKCINCNSLGPQYVCTNFSTFICTNCSGIHREFTHRVKSVSMAKFTSQEVAALQEGGNEHAKEKFFKEWDQQRHSFPDNSDVERLRTFIKHVYVDRRYAGDKSFDRPLRVKGDKEDAYEQRKSDTFRGSQSPSYDEAYDRRSSRSSLGGRSDDRNSRYSYEEGRSPDSVDHGRSPGPFDVVEDRRRENKFEKGNQNVRLEDRRFSDGPSSTDGRSPNHQKGTSTPSPPVVPVRDILGDNVPPLRVGEPPKSDDRRVSPAQALRTVSSSGISSSTEENPAEVKSATIASLIDFSTDPEPPNQSVPLQVTDPPVDGGNWASFDTIVEQKPQHVTTPNSMESGVAQLCTQGNANPVRNVSSLPTIGPNSFTKTVSPWPAIQQNEPSLFSAAATQTTILQSNFPQSFQPVGGPSSRPWAPAVAPSVIGQFSAPTTQLSQSSMMPPVEMGPVAPSQPQSLEAKPTERKELPADLFTSTYPMGPGAVPGWQTRPHHGMGFVFQYPTMTTAPAPSFHLPSKPANPFDEPTIVHASTFPSLAPLQGALPNIVDPSGLLRSSSFTTPTQWMPQQQLSNSMTAIHGGYMPQVPSSNLFQMGNQTIGDAGNPRVSFGIPGTDQNSNTRYPNPSTSSTFAPASGNPFG